MGKILVVRKHLNQGVGDRERSPLGRRQDQVVTSTWVSHPGQNPDQSPGAEAYIPWSLGTKGNKEVEGGPPGWSTDQVKPGFHSLEWISRRESLNYNRFTTSCFDAS